MNFIERFLLWQPTSTPALRGHYKDCHEDTPEKWSKRCNSNRVYCINLFYLHHLDRFSITSELRSSQVAVGGNCIQHCLWQTLRVLHSAATTRPVQLPRVSFVTVTTTFKSPCSQTDTRSGTTQVFLSHQETSVDISHHHVRLTSESLWLQMAVFKLNKNKVSIKSFSFYFMFLFIQNEWEPDILIICSGYLAWSLGSHNEPLWTLHWSRKCSSERCRCDA